MEHKFTKAILTLIVSAYLVMLSGCASTKKPKPNPRADAISPACIMAINFNRYIDWEVEGLKSESIDEEEDTSNEISTEPLMAAAESMIYDAFENFGVGFFDKEVLLNSASYLSAADETILKATKICAADGYYLLSPLNEYEVKVANDISAEYFIYINFRLNRLLRSGSEKKGKVSAYVKTSIEIVDTEGNIVKMATSYTTSKEKLPIVNGIMETEKFFSLYPETIKKSIEIAVKNLS